MAPGLRGIDDAPTEVTAVGNRRRRPDGVSVHRTDSPKAIDVSRTRRIPVTTPARTLPDLGPVAPAETVEAALEDALFQSFRRGGSPEPVRQYRVGGVLLDGAYPAVRLGLEADSRTWHGARPDVQRNSHKAKVLVAHGWRVLRFTRRDLCRRPSDVGDVMAAQSVLACPA